MKRWINIAAQLVLGGGQIVNLAAPLMSDDSRKAAAVVMAGLQLVISVIAHECNPDGTAAAVPYEPKK